MAIPSRSFRSDLWNLWETCGHNAHVGRPVNRRPDPFWCVPVNQPRLFHPSWPREDDFTISLQLPRKCISTTFYHRFMEQSWDLREAVCRVGLDNMEAISDE